MIRYLYILFLLPLLCFGQAINDGTSYSQLIIHADTNWDAGEDTTTYNYSTSGCEGQEMYYAYWNTEAQIYLWRITGDPKYINRALVITQNFINTSETVAFDPSYLGWRTLNATGPNAAEYQANGTALYEKYYWKLVATYLRIMHQSPNFRATAHGHGSLPGTTYQDVFDTHLAFLEEHIWNKWWDRNAGHTWFYRTHTHMTSHWARIGMELYIITGTQKYADFRDEFDFEGFTFGNVGYNMRDQIQEVGSGYIWVADWDGSGIQDTYHLSDIVAYMILSYENGVYWDINDMNALLYQMNNVWFPSSIGANARVYMDGTGGNDVAKRIRDNALLGRFDATFNGRLATQYVTNTNTAYDTQYYAIMAFNKFLLDGNTPVYPEVAGTGDIPVLTIVGANPYNITTADTYVELGAEAIDTEDGDISGSVVIGGDTVNDDVEGQYFVTYDVTDSDLNSPAQEVRTVNVLSTPPATQVMSANKIRLGSGGGGIYLGASKIGVYVSDVTVEPDPGNPNPELVQNDAAAFVSELNAISGIHSPIGATNASIAEATNGYGSYVVRSTPTATGTLRRDRVVLPAANFTNGEIYEVQILERHNNTTGNGRYLITIGSSDGNDDNIHAAHTDWQLHSFEFTYSSGNPQIDIYTRSSVSATTETVDYKISVKQKND